jgi:formylmethanofuran dehydrogenase subunit E
MSVEQERKLPTPHCDFLPTDPQWLREAVQLHGHLGPWLVAGLRLGMAGLAAVESQGYFDIRLTAQGPFDHPPISCFLDGLQVATGATLGKRNLECVSNQELGQLAVRVRNERTSKAVEVRPTATLMQLLASPKSPDDAVPRPASGASRAHTAAESLARQLAHMPDDEILTVTPC